MEEIKLQEFLNNIYRNRIGKKEIKAVERVLKEGRLSYYTSQEVKKFEQNFAEYLGCKYAIAVTSGTAALHMSLDALEIGHKDEVIIPAFTHIAVPLSILYQGGMITFADINPYDYSINVEEIENKITESTKAIIVVHSFGQPAEITRIKKLAKKHGIKVIEDCSHSHGAEISGKKVGSIGDVGCFSFQESKIMTTGGEGGMIVTDDQEIAKKCRERIYLGEDLLTYGYRMDSIRAAIGNAQLEKLDQIIKKRREIADVYARNLPGFLDKPKVNKTVKCVFNTYPCQVVNKKVRDRLISGLQKKKIPVEAYIDKPLNKFKVIQKRTDFVTNSSEKFKNSEIACNRVVLLPVFPSLNRNQIEILIKRIKEEFSSLPREYFHFSQCTLP